jgi:YesN/AraC family two-component response regulator
MSEKDKPGANIRVTVSGDLSGQLAIGSHITQIQQVSTTPPANEAELLQRLADIRAAIQSDAPTEKKTPALERVDELQQAVTNKKPDVETISTMEYIKNWFTKNLPTLAGAVTSVIINPIVGSVVKAAGDLVAAEFKRRFGG